MKLLRKRNWRRLSLGMFVLIGCVGCWSIVAMPRQVTPLRQIAFGIGITSTSLSPDQSVIAVGLSDGQIVLVSYKDWVEVGRFKASSQPVLSIDFSPDGRLIASACGEPIIKVWNVTSHEIDREIASAGAIDVQAIRYSPRGTTLCAATNGGGVRLYATEGMKVIAEYHEAHSKVINPDRIPMIWSIEFSSNGMRIAVGMRNGTAVLSGDDLSELEGLPTVERAADDLAFSPDGKSLAASTDGVRIWNFGKDGGLKHISRESLGNIPGSVHSVCYAADGKYLAIGVSGGPNQASNVVVHGLKEAKLVAVFSCHRDSLAQVMFAPVSNRILTTSFDGTLCEWDWMPAAK